MDVGSLLISNPQTAKLIQPGKSWLDYPPPAPESTAMFRLTLCEEGNDVPRS